MSEDLTCVWKSGKKIDLDAVLNESSVLIWSKVSGMRA
jgi:hypothetical protein